MNDYAVTVCVEILKAQFGILKTSQNVLFQQINLIKYLFS